MGKYETGETTLKGFFLSIKNQMSAFDHQRNDRNYLHRQCGIMSIDCWLKESIFEMNEKILKVSLINW